MIKRLTSLLAAIITLYAALCVPYVFAEDAIVPEFDIQNGELVVYNGSAEEVIIPEGVTKIGGAVFFYKNVKRVTLPDTVKEISAAAFEHSELEEIELPEGLVSIGDEAFSNTKLREIDIPEGIAEIPYFAFFNSPLERVSLPDSLSSVGAYAFANTYLSDVDIPDSVELVASTAFNSTPYLQKLIKEKEGWLILRNGLLVGYYGDAVNAVVPDTVEKIGNKAFLLRTRMKTLTVPDSVKEIDEEAFVNCAPEVVYSENKVARSYFKNCVSLPEQPPTSGGRALDLSKDTWSFANAGDVFGDSYILRDESRELLSEAIEERYRTFDDPWSGSCYGMALTVLLAKYGILSPSDIQKGASTLGDIEPDEETLAIIDHYHFLQYTDSAVKIERHYGMSAVDYFESAVSLGWRAEKEGRPFLLSYNTADGGHTCVGCGLESGEWEWNGKTYDRRIILWDPNFPSEYRDDLFLYYRYSDYDYCVPFYGVRCDYGSFDNVGKLTLVCDDANVLGEPGYPFGVKGDVNADGAFDISDLVLLQRRVLGYDDEELSQPRAADFCRDGVLDAFDLCLMRQELLYPGV